jgi:type 1 fimbriae regulatory protein FimE
LLALLAVARASRERDWLWILVAFRHGLRVSEVVALTPDNLKDGFLTVQRLKGSLRTTQVLVSDDNPLLNEREPLFDYVRNMLPNQRLFPIGRQHAWALLQKYGKAAGLPAHLCHPHILKHSIAMQSIHSAGIENVRQHLGHKSIASTGAYLKVSDADASASVQRALEGPSGS